MTQALQHRLRAHLEQLAALGEVEEHCFQEGSEAGTNLILRLPGQQPRLDPLLVGAHYDGLPLPR